MTPVQVKEACAARLDAEVKAHREAKLPHLADALQKGAEVVRAMSIDTCNGQRLALGQVVTVSRGFENYHEWQGIELTVIAVSLEADGVTFDYTTAEGRTKSGSWDGISDGWTGHDLIPVEVTP